MLVTYSVSISSRYQLSCVNCTALICPSSCEWRKVAPRISKFTFGDSKGTITLQLLWEWCGHRLENSTRWEQWWSKLLLQSRKVVLNMYINIFGLSWCAHVITLSWALSVKWEKANCTRPRQWIVRWKDQYLYSHERIRIVIQTGTTRRLRTTICVVPVCSLASGWTAL